MLLTFQRQPLCLWAEVVLCPVLSNFSAKFKKMESAESQTELLEALLKWMASFRVAAGIIISTTIGRSINQSINQSSIIKMYGRNTDSVCVTQDLDILLISALY